MVFRARTPLGDRDNPKTIDRAQETLPPAVQRHGDPVCGHSSFQTPGFQPGIRVHEGHPLSAAKRIIAIVFVVVVVMALLPVFLHGAQLEWMRSGIIGACGIFSLGSLVLNRWEQGVWVPEKNGVALPARALWILGLVFLAILAYAIVKPLHLFGNWFDAAVLLSFIVLLLAFRWQSRGKGKGSMAAPLE